MEYVYAAMLLHKSGQDLTEDNVTKVLKAAKVDVDDARVKSLIAALEDVDIEEAISSAVIASSAPAAAPAAESTDTSSQDASKEEESEDDEDDDEDAAEGLGSLFG